MPTEDLKRKVLSRLGQGLDAGLLAAFRANVKDSRPHFMQMFVLEVISDPKKITKEKVEYWQQVLKINLHSSQKYVSGPEDFTEQNFPRILPRNTIIAQQKLMGGSKFTPPMFVLPFFPSHLSLPCKPGELVWAMFQDPNIGGEKLAYWMCSVVQPYFIEDVNHTHMPMFFRPPAINKNSEAKIPYELRNGVVSISKDKDGKITDSKGNVIFKTDIHSQVLLSDQEDIFEKLIEATDAGQMSSYESVPRFHKRPGDVALEGSNNTLIVLGTERQGPMATFSQGTAPNTTQGAVNPVNPGMVPTWPVDDYKENCGTIDMVAGRGYTLNTGGSPVDVTYIAGNGVIKQELDKLNPPIDEGDPDFRNDRSRVQISQRTTPDANFKLDSYFTEKLKITDGGFGDAAVIIKSDKIRLIARSDISFVVTSFDQVPATPQSSNIKTSFKDESSDQKKWASITIRSNGDIIFTPAEKGLIKLGGDDADKAILCTDNIGTKPTAENGQVKYQPGIISTGADLIGTGKPKQGTFATKILVK